MASHIKGVQHTTMTYEMHKALCEYKSENPTSSQKELQKWVFEKFNIQISQATISNTIKRSLKYLSADLMKPNDIRHKSVKFPNLENALYEWILQHQERVNISRELIQEKDTNFMKILYGDNGLEFYYSLGWVERFKSRHGIKSFRRFGESGSVNMGDEDNSLPTIREKLWLFTMKYVFNMDEIGVFYRLQVDHSLAKKTT
ncbi:CENP-B homolog protein 2-like [Impatiens glandulifera]|uniref:CENP-B homolog protein 2-like n=1 Tax=Impatiens glandulifera TaxID=253017 RepID=UPI001FB0AE05|nr:CENP-B homolog protein 2-like [Impatiens glandulifera]